MRNVTTWRRLPAQPAVYAPFPPGLDARLAAALADRGVTQLYRHQAAAVAAALRGEHVAVVTPAASGKTLCYNLPVLHRLLADPAARALYLFPTKALAQDQLAALTELSGDLALVGGAATYDGDTPSGQRTKIRDNARIILSNPDMLHAGILPQHTRWAGFFANLRVVVIDEMHAYRGVFGSHVANVLRRLRRICRFYGNEPQFIFASATIANPGELAGRLAEAPVTVIGPEQNGAPQGERNIVLYNPPIVDASLGIRRSAAQEAATWAAHFVDHGVQTIVFAGSRLTTELILLDLREQLRGPEGAPGRGTSAIRGYRGGYLPNERREIERGLRNGSLRGVVATNALELGIDIGQLGAALLAGYPGAIASAWQEMGRAGRRQEAAAAMLIASANPLDQYIIAHPEYLLGSSPERAMINPDNPMILADHLACAAAELPFDRDEGFGKLVDVSDLLAYLAQSGELYEAGGRYFWGGEGYPAANVSLRTSSPDRVVIQTEGDAGKPLIIGELDRFSVPLLVYEGAIYIHGGETYLVEKLEWDEGIAHVRRTAVDYYTRPSIGEEVEVLAEHAGRDETALSGATDAAADGRALSTPDRDATPARAASPSFRVAWGDVRVVSKASGFRILKRSTHEMLGYGTIELPEQVLETTACWLAFSTELVEQLKAAGEWFSDPNEYGPSWPAQRAAARARDEYRCQSCGIPEREGKQHDVHHKIPFRAFVADASLRPGLSSSQAWQVANQLDNLVTLCSSCHKRAEASVRTRSGLGGVAWALAGVAPLHLMCDPRDLGMVVEPQSPTSKLPTITIYEKVPAGIGYAAELYRLMSDLLRAAYDLVTACPCERGCPACVGPVLDHDYALDTKALSIALLKAVCGPKGLTYSISEAASVAEQWQHKLTGGAYGDSAEGNREDRER
jgi:DEAD/DEAH box helicase domain-containing protein